MELVGDCSVFLEQSTRDLSLACFGPISQLTWSSLSLPVWKGNGGQSTTSQSSRVAFQSLSGLIKQKVLISTCKLSLRLKKEQQVVR